MRTEAEEGEAMQTNCSSNYENTPSCHELQRGQVREYESVGTAAFSCTLLNKALQSGVRVWEAR
jgi:hypothetical protein